VLLGRRVFGRRGIVGPVRRILGVVVVEEGRASGRRGCSLVLGVGSRLDVVGVGMRRVGRLRRLGLDNRLVVEVDMGCGIVAGWNVSSVV